MLATAELGISPGTDFQIGPFSDTSSHRPWASDYSIRLPDGHSKCRSALGRELLTDLSTVALAVDEQSSRGAVMVPLGVEEQCSAAHGPR